MKIKTIYVGIAASLLILIEVFILFGFTGVRTIVGMFLFFVLPFYVILNNFKIDIYEKIFYSIFLSMGLYPLIVWVINRLIPSLIVSLILVSLLLIIIGFAIQNLLRKNRLKI